MNLPLHIITENDGIPIPGGIYILDIPIEHSSLFIPAEVNGNKQIILGLSTKEDPEDLRELAINTQKIGVLCTVKDQTETDNYILVTLYIESRVYLESFETIGSIQGGSKHLKVSFELVSEEFLPPEEKIIDDIEKFTKVILDNPILFGQIFTEELNTELYPENKLNIMANHILKDTVRRTEFLLSENNNERFQLIIDRVQEVLKSDNVDFEPKQQVVKKQKKPRIHNTASIKSQFQNLPIDEETREHIEREIQKLDNLPKSSTEHSMVLDYMSWILDIPWQKFSKEECNLQNLTDQLNETHYGLEDVKQHILEHITIEKIKGTSTGTVLCFTGPPGTGKTSIAVEIAKATNRQLSRIALGGLSDEAELRGHRRTYIGSRPGRLIVGLKKAKTMDPLFLLDEIDKLGSGRSDPAAALLEILDPEQNHCFTDRYLEVPVDLSRAMFICTANYEDQIPEALKDRMEFIHFSSYNKNEREVITRDYLIPRSFNALSLNSFNIVFTDEAIDYLIQNNQVRQIEKTIKKLLKMAAVDIVVRGTPSISIDSEYIKKIPKLQSPKPLIGFKGRNV